MGHDATVNALLALEQHHVLVSGGEDHEVMLWDERTWKRVMCVGHAGNVHGLCADVATDFMFFSCSADMTVKKWDIRMMTMGGSDEQQQLQYHNQQLSVQQPLFPLLEQQLNSHVQTLEEDDFYIDDASLVASGNQGRNASNSESEAFSTNTTQQYDGNHSCLHTIQSHYGAVFCCTTILYKHQPLIVFGCKNGIVQAVDPSLSGNQSVLDFKGHYADVTCCGYYKNGNWLITGCKDKTVRIWNIENQECVHVLDHHEGAVTCLLVNGDDMYTGSLDGTVRCYNLANGIVQTRIIERPAMQVFSICVDKQNRLYIGSDEDWIRCFD